MVRSRLNALATGWAVGALLLVPSAALANDTDNVLVSAVVTNNCTITAAALAFGNYDQVDVNAAAPLEGTGSVTVACTDGFSVTVTLDEGATPNVGSSGITPLREMTFNAEVLTYKLFSDSGRTTVWGDDVASDVAFTGTGDGVALTIFGSVDPGQNIPAGTYNDTVVATVVF